MVLNSSNPRDSEAGPVHGDVAVGEEMSFDDGLEGGFTRWLHRWGPRINRARSSRSSSNGVMHLIPKPMQASGILILRVEAEGISCVTTMCFPACAWATR